MDQKPLDRKSNPPAPPVQNSKTKPPRKERPTNPTMSIGELIRRAQGRA